MIKISNKSNEKVEFITDMPLSLANAVRRSVNEITILAIDSVEISKNDSALYDEIIAQRLGLVPLKNENLKLTEDCDCKEKGCSKCSLKLKLKAEGPGIVYSTELSPKGQNICKIPITLLDKNQELEFVAIAKVGKGIKHAKFSPGLFYYKYSKDATSSNLKEDDEEFRALTEAVEKDEDKELLVNIESWGQIKAKDIFIGAVDALNENLKKLVKKVK